MGRNSLATLRQFVREKPETAAVERCELCSLPISSRHRHLLEIANRQIMCACDGCALRFQNVIGARYKLIPRDSFVLPNFQMSDAQWDNLAIPINLAFFVFSTPAERLMALYPSPAGATESTLSLEALSLEAWETLAAANPRLLQMEADVEALLVNRVGATHGYYLAPIDTCFKLVGLLRIHWRGLSGGEKVWKEVEQFFAELKEKSSAI
jgi:hypothetical protein